jgi:hypothetical protein
VNEVSWSRCDDEECVRVSVARAGDHVRVFPRMTAGVDLDGLPPMAGRLVRDQDRDDICFIPRFAFVDGTAYAVVIDGATVAVLDRPTVGGPATTEVADIRPTTREVPRNLLRLYVSFSAPMQEGCAAANVRIVSDNGGEMIEGALLATERELWDPDRRRLTVLLDPARIKRGLVGQREVGYPLRQGATIRLVVDAGFLDATGLPLRAGAEQRYEVGGDERGHVDPEGWTLTAPASDTLDGLTASFDRPLDHGLLARGLRVIGADGHEVEGTAEIGPEERSWRWRPLTPWVRGRHRLAVDPLLEDLAGNSVTRVFDRDMTRPEDDPRTSEPVVVTFDVT